jgi:nickel-dependent lactate racemase
MKNSKEDQKHKEFVQKWIDDMEFDFLSRAVPDEETRRTQIPVVGKERIKALIYNLLRSESFTYKLNYKTYSAIMDVYIERLAAN